MPALSWPQLEEIFAKAAAGGAEGFGAADFDTFVETGTGLGQTILPLSAHFRELHTVEIKEEFFEASRLMASAAKAPICFYHGPSEEVLPEIIGRLRGPTVFFLDAHWSGEDTGRGSVDVPLLEELRALDAQLPHKALLILDDLRLFAEGERRVRCEVDWDPVSLDAVRASVRPSRVAHAFELGDRYVVALRAAPGAGPRARGPGGGSPAPLDGNTVDGVWRQPFVSAPGAPMDAEALARLATRGDDYLHLARRIQAMNPRWF